MAFNDHAEHLRILSSVLEGIERLRRRMQELQPELSTSVSEATNVARQELCISLVRRLDNVPYATREKQFVHGARDCGGRACRRRPFRFPCNSLRRSAGEAGRAVLRGSRIRLPPRAPARAAADQCGTAARTDPRDTGTAPGSAAPLARPTESASRCRTLCT
jgi:hypothetical protein